MKLTKFDIGAEVISILTKGMYPDPRDAVREYIQNAVDAKARNVSVSVRQSSVVVEDDGVGMDYVTLRKALRIGISDKQPGKDVGFMGIGIYSAFHLCDTLTIYTRKADTLPQMLQMNFDGMRLVLKEQRDRRLNGQIDGDQLTDLQTLLESNITLIDEGVLSLEEYPVTNGTRVEIVGLNPILDDLLNDFNKLGDYLRDVVPLHFDAEKFRWAKLIETKINETCDANNAHFELVNLKLSVNGREANLYRPYADTDFDGSNPQDPDFQYIKNGSTLLGIAWGCLNSARKRIENLELRGFLLKKQGFSIGKRESLSRLFGSSNTFFDRYVGEIIVVSPDILPNAARNGLEFSNLKIWFDEYLGRIVAPYFNAKANEFQEVNRAEELLDDLGGQFKKILTRFNPSEDNVNTLVGLVAEINSNIKSKLNASRNGKVVRSKRKAEFNKLLNEVNELENSIKKRLNFLVKSDESFSRKPAKSKVEIARGLTLYKASETYEKFDPITEVLDKLGIEYSDAIRKVLLIIDEKFVQSIANNKSHYYKLLSEFKEEIENSEI